MKKLISVILSLCIIAGALPVFTASAQPVAEEPILRVGIFSDSQLSSTTSDNMKALVGALNDFKKRGVDLIIHAGDIADANGATIYPYYLEQLATIFPDGIEHLEVPGNHDIWSENSLATYKQYLGEPNKHIVVKGYHFITICSEPYLGTATNGNYGSYSKEYAATEFAKAAADSVGKPFFVITHQHISDTVYCSESWGNDFLHGIIENYPNAVHFSGHSHFVLEDERSIWQGDFTAVGTASLSYTELEYGKANGSVPPEAEKAKQYLYMEIFSDRVDITRIKASDGKQIKNKWVLALPLTKETFTYTDDRAESRTAPYFDSTAAITHSTVGKNVVFTFPAAKHEDFVHSYRIKLFKNGEAEPIKNELFFSDFYKGLSYMTKTLTWTIGNVITDYSFYRVEIYPIESFGKVGEPLVSEFATVDPVAVPKLNRGNLLSLDFVTGAPRNSLATSVLTEQGSGSVAYPGGSAAYDLAANGWILSGPTPSHYTMMAKKFTQEVIFSVRGFKTEQDIMTCHTSTGGVRMWVDTAGNLHFTAMNSSKKDVDVYAPIKANEIIDAAATYDSATLKLYINGTLAASTAMTGSVTYNRTAKYAFGGTATGENLMDGYLYNAALSSSTLSADDLAKLCAANEARNDMTMLLPVYEQVRRTELLKEVNADNIVISTLLDYYIDELKPLTCAFYVTSDAVTNAINGRDIDSYIEVLGGKQLGDYTGSPVISGITDGETYDIEDGAPAATFENCTDAAIDGSPYAAGTPVTALGAHRIIAYNGWHAAGVNFTVVGPEPVVPVVSGITDGETYNLADGDAPAATWTPDTLTAMLDSQPYVAGTPITALGWHTLTITTDSAVYVYMIKVIDQLKGDFDGDKAITVTDALAALRIAVELVAEDDANLAIGDFDGDGHVTVSDALAILRIAAKITE